ncbi:caspase family protein [Estrella lausannensis]|uniref:Putative caspase n=1 Tax=Estrella lausannensis TaxID=483423 RepID=A0A0H5DP10_9BACT|nr:caspase family protein [Estrella lausannensis]CRX37613.1 Putative caspase [Estrella lausannensis]
MNKKIRLSLVLAFACACLALLPHAAFSATLHTIILGDTQDRSIGRTVNLDVNKMKEHGKTISKYSGLELNEIVITGSNLNSTNIITSLENLQVSDDDAIILYYSGHGYRTDNPQDNIWPNIALPGWKGINLEYMTEILINKNPRFILAIGDICNNVIPEKYAPETLIKRDFFQDEENISANYRKLFAETKAVIIASGSSPKLYSYCDEVRGGHFTYHYLRFLGQAVNNPAGTADWDHILSETRSVLYQQQQPQYQIIWMN